MRLTSFAIAALLCGPLVAAAATPPAAAKPEKKAKPAAGGDASAKVYTNDDLEHAKDGSSGKGGAVTFLAEPAVSGESGESGTSSASSEGGSSEGRQASREDGSLDESGWRARVREYREAVSASRVEVERLEAKLQGLSNPMRQPQPIEALQPDPNHLLTTSEERQQLEKELESARGGLAEAEHNLSELLEDARRKGVPAGWLE